MTVLKPAPVNMNQLTWLPDERRFVGEISSTNGFGRVYDDACDEGLTLVNPRTGNEVVFAVHSTQYRDGEIIGWTLVSVMHYPARGPRTVPVMTIHLFND